MITYVHGDATVPQGPGIKFLAHVVNNKGGWGAGFVLAVSKRWKTPEEQYREWYKRKTHTRAGYFELGSVQIVPVEDHIWVCNMIAQDGYKSEDNPVPVKYDALEKCLEKVGEAARIRKASVHLPRIGTGLGGASWVKIEVILQRTLEGLPVTVYEYP